MMVENIHVAIFNLSNNCSILLISIEQMMVVAGSRTMVLADMPVTTP